MSDFTRSCLCVTSVILSVGCSQQEKRQTLVTAAGTNDFVPIDPLTSEQITFRDPGSGRSVTKAWATLTPNRILQLLPSQRGQITTSKVDASGDVKYLTASFAKQT